MSIGSGSEGVWRVTTNSAPPFPEYLHHFNEFLSGNLAKLTTEDLNILNCCAQLFVPDAEEFISRFLCDAAA